MGELGTVSATGALTRGIVRNMGGGEVDTEVDSGVNGDTIIRGSQSVNTSTKTLRPSFVIAGGEHVKPDEESNMQSNALFESFSWVPDGNGLGPSNQLHLQNKQNDVFRFGMEQLSHPRRLEETGMPHPVPAQWMDAMPTQNIVQSMKLDAGMEAIKEEAIAFQTSNPIYVLDNDYNNSTSSKHLPRQQAGPSPFEGVVDNYRNFLPSYDPSGMIMDSLGYQDNYSGTWGHARENSLGRL